jgi:hypothetical protein
MAARPLEQNPSYGMSIEVTVDLMLRPVREGDPSRPQLFAEQLLGIPVCSPPFALGASLSLRLFGHHDLHGSASS